MDHKQAAISFFYRHPEYFWHGVSAYYPLSEEDLVRYGDVLQWQFVSQNESIHWTIPMVERFSDRLYWDNFSVSRFFVEVEHIKRYSSKIDWGFGDCIGSSIVDNPHLY